MNTFKALLQNAEHDTKSKTDINLIISPIMRYALHKIFPKTNMDFVGDTIRHKSENVFLCIFTKA